MKQKKKEVKTMSVPDMGPGLELLDEIFKWFGW